MIFNFSTGSITFNVPRLSSGLKPFPQTKEPKHSTKHIKKILLAIIFLVFHLSVTVPNVAISRNSGRFMSTKYTSWPIAELHVNTLAFLWQLLSTVDVIKTFCP